MDKSARRSHAAANRQLIRRSVALPRQLVDDVLACAPPELAHNLNQLVAASLREYIAHRQALAFDEAMREMAADPGIQAASTAISAEFDAAAMDGLRR
ncbi:MAG: hypothetical protein IPP47_18245 [Bryobacterales bacterium]|nr:hypothetical protein [Bryobacterales bacterium]